MRALTLSGGGALGAYQTGAIKHLLGERKEQYDIIAGTSVGAINGSYLAMFALGDEHEAAEGLEKLWLGIDNSKIWRKWYWGILGMLPVVLPKWLFGKQSVYCTQPLRDLVEQRLKPKAVAESGKKLRIGAVNLNTGERRVWTEEDVAELKKAVCASSAFPMFFEPVSIGGMLYIDSGVREVTPVEDAILAGADEIDVIETGPAQVVGQFDPTANGLALGQRIIDSMSAEIEQWDLRVVELYNNLYDAKHPSATGKSRINLRVLRPQQSLQTNGLDFDPTMIRTNIARGYQDAKAAGW
jgi:NTE family protein